MCRRECVAQMLFSCLRGMPGGARLCQHGTQWLLMTDRDGFYVVTSWSKWRRRWVVRAVEKVMVDRPI